MSDTKLRPEDLTSEERAIVDNAALFYRQVTGDVGETAEWAYVEALKEAEPIILARRALFAPAPEKVAKVECPNCGEMTSESHADGILFGTEKYMAALRRKSAYGRPRTDYEEQSCPVFSFAYSDGFVNFEPAPPEPAAPVNGSTPVGEYDPDMKPAAREMTTIRPYTAKDVRAWIAARGYLSAEQYNDFGRVLPTSNMGACMEALAEALEEIERNLAQPVAVGMTEELEHVLSIAERDLRYKEECFDNSARTVHDERIERLRAAIAAVREQCGRK